MEERQTIIGYKFIKKDMKSYNGNHKWKVGKWYKENSIKLCNTGFHACKEPLEALSYVYGDKFFMVEAKGKVLEEKNDKFVAQEMRLIREIDANSVFKPFAIWCAKQCLENYEKVYPDDKRVFRAIEGAELYLDGKIDLNELNDRISAAESAAWSAESAAKSAESAAWSAAWSAAGSAARSAARSAAESAESAAESAAKSAAREKQNHKLKQIIKESMQTPEIITDMKSNEIFVFGSNLNGNHAEGAAKLAKDKFKAKEGIGEGLTGKSYAFPTLDKNMNKRSIKELKESVNKLIECANKYPEKVFYLTKVGCGIANYKESKMKELFSNLPLNISKPKGW